MVDRAHNANRHKYLLFIWPDHGPITRKEIDMALVAAAGDRVPPPRQREAETDEVIRQIRADPRFAGVNADSKRALLREMVKFMGGIVTAPGMVYYCPGTIPGAAGGASGQDIEKLTKQWQEKLRDELARQRDDLTREKAAALEALTKRYETRTTEPQRRIVQLERARDELQEKWSAAEQELALVKPTLAAAQKRIGELEVLEERLRDARARLKDQKQLELELRNLRAEKERARVELERVTRLPASGGWTPGPFDDSNKRL